MLLKAYRSCVWSFFHQGNSVLSPVRGNKGIYQRYIGLLCQCSAGSQLGESAAPCDRVMAYGTCYSFCYWLHGVPNHACHLLLNWQTFNVLSMPAVSKLQVVQETALLLPQDTLSSCSVRTSQEHCWFLPVIAYRLQSQKTSKCREFFCPQTVKYIDLYQFNAVREAKEHERGRRKQNGRGSRQVGRSAFSPMSTGIEVTHWYTNPEAQGASPTFPAKEIIYCTEMIQWP